jgi:hypothetical protein
MRERKKMNEYLIHAISDDSWEFIKSTWTTPLFTCSYCREDIIEDGIIKRGNIFCNTDCAIKYSLQEAV